MVSGTNGKDDGIPPEDLKNKEWIEPPVASKIVENGPPYVVPKNGQVEENGNGGTVDKAAKEAQLLASTSEAIALKVTEGKLEVQKIKALESAKEVAGKHLAKFGAFYLMVMVLVFILSASYLPGDSIAVIAGLVTLVVTNISGILKSISTEESEQKDPIELMYDIAEKNSESCEREMKALVESSERQQAALLEHMEKTK
jgi:hypothetical protein|tara:strand:+ start:45 stop:644 length:600 start_codon:yes stop_codon:yes gene_type:complete